MPGKTEKKFANENLAKASSVCFTVADQAPVFSQTGPQDAAHVISKHRELLPGEIDWPAFVAGHDGQRKFFRGEDTLRTKRHQHRVQRAVAGKARRLGSVFPRGVLVQVAEQGTEVSIALHGEVTLQNTFQV